MNKWRRTGVEGYVILGHPSQVIGTLFFFFFIFSLYMLIFQLQPSAFTFYVRLQSARAKSCNSYSRLDRQTYQVSCTPFSTQYLSFPHRSIFNPLRTRYTI